jgi:membrane associated rhomboid family serine protease
MFPVKSAVACRYPPVVTWTLIAANCAVFFHQIALGPDELEWFVFQYALIPARYFSPELDGGGPLAPADYLPFISNIFLHSGWLHLILNMWSLWLFGPAVEDRLGHTRYLVFYLAAGIIASATHAVVNATSEVPALGASGAIAGVLGCYIRLFPFARMIVLVPILFFPLFFEVPAILFAGFWFIVQLLQGTAGLLTPSFGDGIAWWAHIGGFVAGAVLAPLLRRPNRSYRPYYPDEGILGFDPAGRR